MNNKQTSISDSLLRYTINNKTNADDTSCVEAFTTTNIIGRNPELLCAELNTPTSRFARPHQVHGVVIRQIAEEFFTLPGNIREMLLNGVDAVIYDVKDACIGISTADCIPVLCYDAHHHCAAAIHAGWRGTVDRIAVRCIEQMQATYGTTPSDLQCIIGPGISLESFEVGNEVYLAFAEKGFPMEQIAMQMPAKHVGVNNGVHTDDIMKWHIDLKECNRMQLISLGVKEENIYVSNIDTLTDNRFFSARRDGADTGRMLSGIILR